MKRTLTEKEREWQKEYMKKYYAANKEKMKERARKWYADNKERALANVDRWTASNPEKVKASSIKWNKNNKDRRNAAWMKRHAAKLQATPQWANAEKIAEFYAAADFLGMVTGEWYHVDHIVPLLSKKVCGLHCEQNLRVLPQSDNIRKGNRHWPDMP